MWTETKEQWLKQEFPKETKAEDREEASESIDLIKLSQDNEDWAGFLGDEGLGTGADPRVLIGAIIYYKKEIEKINSHTQWELDYHRKQRELESRKQWDRMGK